MSFILDALRKSEHERQRSAAPTIAQVPFATPRERVPRWVVPVIAVLAASVFVIGGAWWLSSRAPATGELPVAAAPSARQASRPLELPPPAAPARRPPAASESLSAAVPAPGALPENEPAPERRSSSRPASGSFDDEAPRIDAPDEAPAFPAASRPTEPPEEPAGATLPSAAALAAEGIMVPTLRLELHAFSEQPRQRFVFINGRRYGEGETLAEGPRLVAIEPQGAVLSHQGRRFLLAPE
jgi:general secretion pathway protein B